MFMRYWDRLSLYSGYEIKNEKFIQSLIGHEKNETTHIYAQLSGKHRKDFYQKYF